MPAAVPQALEDCNVLSLASWLLQNVSHGAHDDRVSGNDQRRLALFGIDFLTVDGCAFLFCCLQDVFEGSECFAEVFGNCAGDDLEVSQADLIEQLLASRRGRCEDDSLATEGLQCWELKGQRGAGDLLADWSGCAGDEGSVFGIGIIGRRRFKRHLLV